RDVWFRYERDGRDVLRGTSLTAEKGEIFAILGGNGSGKSTALLAASGILRPYAGEIRVLGKKLAAYRGRSLHDGCVAMLPQDVQTLFLANTVAGELADAGCDPAALPFDLSPVLDRHPYDLSGGQQQLLGLAKVLASRPRVLLLDEPTKGLDAGVKAEIAALLHRLRDGGTAVVLVTHDVEFAAGAADRCAMFFRGEITSAGSPRTFFAGNSFYTTAADRMTRGFFDGAVTVEDAAALCRKNGRKSG
ncbi:MAG: ABC transporter ATP-binding protein, partial [Oscillospiraceae bacterium]|nr:ABC transporter ATP-binding protein [Oscillospiraceae bacterium]